MFRGTEPTRNTMENTFLFGLDPAIQIVFIIQDPNKLLGG